MKPQFALILSSDSVALLHRRKRGWEELGSVAPDDPNFRSRLADLRARALERSPEGIETKLVLPESQVLYTSIASPGRDDAARRDAVRRALEGMTPYAVDELVFDYEAEGDVLHIAVVARETLDEAEDFAAEHRFNPVSIVARPAGGSFTSEPFFGETASAAAILPEGERVERDVLPTQVTLKLTQRVAPTFSAPPSDASGEAAPATPGATAPEAATDAPPQIRVFYEDDDLPPPADGLPAPPPGATDAAAAFLPGDPGAGAPAGTGAASDAGADQAFAGTGVAGIAEVDVPAAEPERVAAASSAAGGAGAIGAAELPESDGADLRRAVAGDDTPRAAVAAGAAAAVPSPVGDDAGPSEGNPPSGPDAAAELPDGAAVAEAFGTPEERQAEAAGFRADRGAADGRDATGAAIPELSDAPAETALPAAPSPSAEAAGQEDPADDADASRDDAFPAEVEAARADGRDGADHTAGDGPQGLTSVAARLQGAPPASPFSGSVPGSRETPGLWQEAGTTVRPKLGPAAVPVGVTSGSLPPIAGLTAPDRRVSRSTTVAPGGPRTARARATALAQAPAGLRKVLARPRPAPAAAQGGAVFGRRAAPARRSPLMAFVLTTGLVALLAAVGLWSAVFRPPGTIPALPAPDAPSVALLPDEAVRPARSEAPMAPPPAGTAAGGPPDVDDTGPAFAALREAPADNPVTPGVTVGEPTALPPPSAEGKALAGAGAGAGDASAGPAARLVVPALAPGADPGAAVPAGQPPAAAPRGSDARSAAVAYAATGIWIEAPAAPAAISEDRPAGGIRGAVDPRLPDPPPSLLTVAGLKSDLPPDLPAPPPPPGALRPAEAPADPQVAGGAPEAGDAILVVEGRPPVIPPGRPASALPRDVTSAAPDVGTASAAAEAADAPGVATAVAEDAPFALPGTPATPPRPRTSAFVETARAASAQAAEDVPPGEPAAAGGERNPLAGVRPRPRPFPALPGTDQDAGLTASPTEAAAAQLAGAAGLGASAVPVASDAVAAAAPQPPQERPEVADTTDVAAAALRPARDPALAALRPRARPGTALAAVAAPVPDPVPASRPEAVTIAPVADPALAGLRPSPRPFAVPPPETAAAGPDVSAPGVPTAAPQSFAGATELAVAVVPVPRGRPQGFAERAQLAAAAAAAARAVAAAPPPAPAPAAVAPAAAAPAPQTTAAAAVAAAPAGRPRIPTSASVAGQATVENAIRLNRVNLIGIYGGSRDRRALVRLPSGRYVKVEVGDRVDGGRVAAISERELRLVKGGRNIVLRVGEGN